MIFSNKYKAIELINNPKGILIVPTKVRKETFLNDFPNVNPSQVIVLDEISAMRGTEFSIVFVDEEINEATDPIKSYGKGYIGVPMLPNDYCRCPDQADKK